MEYVSKSNRERTCYAISVTHLRHRILIIAMVNAHSMGTPHNFTPLHGGVNFIMPTSRTIASAVANVRGLLPLNSSAMATSIFVQTYFVRNRISMM